MWKIDNNSELNKLYKDIKISKYISDISDEDSEEAEKISKEEYKIIEDLKNFIFDIVLSYFELNDSIGALYYFDTDDNVATTDYFYNFLTYTCMNYEYGFIDTSIKDT